MALQFIPSLPQFGLTGNPDFRSNAETGSFRTGFWISGKLEVRGEDGPPGCGFGLPDFAKMGQAPQGLAQIHFLFMNVVALVNQRLILLDPTDFTQRGAY